MADPDHKLVLLVDQSLPLTADPGAVVGRRAQVESDIVRLLGEWVAGVVVYSEVAVLAQVSDLGQSGLLSYSHVLGSTCFGPCSWLFRVTPLSLSRCPQ